MSKAASNKKRIKVATESKPKDNQKLMLQQKIFTDSVKTTDRRSEIQRTFDGFQNFTSRLGYGNCNTLSDGFYSFNLITRNRIQLEAAYRGSWISRKMIDIPAKDMTRAGIEILTNDGAEKIKELQSTWSKLQIWQSISTGIKWGALYGGALGILQIKGQKLDTPLDPDTIGKDQFQGIAVYDRWQLNPDLTDVIDSGPEIGLPKYYYIVTSSEKTTADQATDAGNIKVHYSRCIRFGGSPLPFFQAITEMMWDASVLEVLWDRLIAFDTATMSTASLIDRAQLRMVGVNDLRSILAAGGKAQEALISQFEMIRQLQTNEGITLLDKEDSFDSVAYSFSGLDAVLLAFAQHLSGATDIPLIRLFSQTPTGMNATGESELRLYYDGINARQNAELRNPVLILIRVLWKSIYGETMPKDLDFNFESLWQMTQVEKAGVAKSNAEVIMGAHDSGLIGKATALKELRHDSKDSGLFSNISDEEIEQAEEEDENPPMPELDPSQEQNPDVKKEASPPQKSNQLSSDSAWGKIKKWITKN